MQPRPSAETSNRLFPTCASASCFLQSTFHNRCINPPIEALLRSQRGHIDREPVLHIALEKPLIGFVHLLNRNHLHIAVMLCWPQKSSISCVSASPPIGEPTGCAVP